MTERDEREENLDPENLEEILQFVKHIIWRSSRIIRIHLWTDDEYQQEARLVLHNLLQSGITKTRLYTHFKVRYRQRLIDIKRREVANKRGFDQGAGLDVYDYADILRGSAPSPEYFLICEGLLDEVAESLESKYCELLQRQLSGEELPRMDKHRLKEKVKEVLYRDNYGL